MFLKLCTTKLAPSSTHLHPAHFRTLISHVLSNFTKFRPKNSKLFILTENWHIREIGGIDFKSRLFFFLKFGPQNLFLGKFGPKKSKLSVLPEHWHTWYLEEAESYSNISFLNLQPYINFWANLGQKG